MILAHSVEVFILLVIEAVRHVGCDVTYCPRSLYDCDSLESGLHSSADVIITPEFMSSAHDDNYIGEICKFFKSPECSDPIVDQCKGEVVYATKAFKNRQHYICGDRFTRKGMRSLKTCVRQFHRHFSRCQQKRHAKLEEVTYVTQTTTTSHPWCNLTNDYIICVYSVMALGCTLEVAEKYMETVNQSAPVVEAIYGYGCSFGHPLDILKTTSPPPDTTSYGYRYGAGYSSGKRPTGSRRSGAVTGHEASTLLLFLCIVAGFSLVERLTCKNLMEKLYSVVLWRSR